MEPAKENETVNNQSMEELMIDGPLNGTDTSYKWVEENTDLQKINNGFPIHMIEEVMKIRDFDVEFRVLKRITETTKHSDQLLEYHPSHLHMNRYKNVIPFKSTLVTLPKDPLSTEESQYFDTYINANYVSSCFKNSDKFFIATQGPLDGTRKNFWKMVWTENASSILMLCKPIENATGNIQCNIYWPRETGKSLDLDGYKVTLEKETENLPGLVRRDLVLEFTDPDTKVTSSRKVRQYQCQKWPDNGVPPKEDYNQVDELIKIMDEEKANNPDKTIIIHCSAGIGRSGTLIAIYNLLRTINYYRTIYTRDDDEETKASYKISVFGTVRRIREQRWGSVQTNEQYTFIYEFIKDYCIRIGFV